MRALLIFIFMSTIPSLLSAQESSELLINKVTEDGFILTAKGISTVDLENNSTMKEILFDQISYSAHFKVQVNTSLFYEIGTLELSGGQFDIMLIKNKATDDADIEFMVIYEQNKTEENLELLAQRRSDWMTLCNAHKAADLVKDLYTSNAYYYNRGRLIQGTEAITQEYAYMNSPNYSLKLTPTHIKFVNENIAYEIGQCSGSYPLPYMLLWEKQTDGRWQVLMDSNY